MSESSSGLVLAAIEGTSLSVAERDILRHFHPAGFTLFKRNIPSPLKETAALNQELQQTRPTGAKPLVIAVDQEGGRVSRLPDPFPNLGPALNLAGGATSEDALKQLASYGHEVGTALKNLGFNVDFAPVLDIHTEPRNTAIGDRCFADQPEAVEQRAGAFLRGLQKSGIHGCLKHFPGQGHAIADTHLEQTSISLAATELWERELVPFRALVSQVSMVMLSHVIYSDLSSMRASASSEVIMDLLRGRLGFDGAVLSDDMNMEAVDQKDFAAEVIQSILAGTDLILICRDLERALGVVQEIDRAATASPALRERVDKALDRVASLRGQLLSVD